MYKEALWVFVTHFYLPSPLKGKKATSCSCVPKSTRWWKGELSVRRKSRISHFCCSSFCSQKERRSLSWLLRRRILNPDVDKWNGGPAVKLFCPPVATPTHPPTVSLRTKWKKPQKYTATVIEYITGEERGWNNTNRMTGKDWDGRHHIPAQSGVWLQSTLMQIGLSRFFLE